MLVSRWRYRAAVCKYAHQNVYTILGRDPVKEPLTAVELAIFARCTFDLVNRERETQTPLTQGDDDG